MTSLSSPARRRWRAWRGASDASRRDVLSIGALVPVMHLSVRTLGYARTSRWAARLGHRAPDHEAAALAARGAEAVRRLRAHGLVRGNCLSRALGLQRWLAVRGVTSVVRFGARPEGAALAAHAWLEYGGTPITDASDVADQFPPLGRG
jgi:hypothetical protein